MFMIESVDGGSENRLQIPPPVWNVVGYNVGNRIVYFMVRQNTERNNGFNPKQGHIFLCDPLQARCIKFVRDNFLNPVPLFVKLSSQFFRSN